MKRNETIRNRVFDCIKMATENAHKWFNGNVNKLIRMLR